MCRLKAFFCLILLSNCLVAQQITVNQKPVPPLLSNWAWDMKNGGITSNHKGGFCAFAQDQSIVCFGPEQATRIIRLSTQYEGASVFPQGTILETSYPYFDANKIAAQDGKIYPILWNNYDPELIRLFPVQFKDRTHRDVYVLSEDGTGQMTQLVRSFSQLPHTRDGNSETTFVGLADTVRAENGKVVISMLSGASMPTRFGFRVYMDFTDPRQPRHMANFPRVPEKSNSTNGCATQTAYWFMLGPGSGQGMTLYKRSVTSGQNADFNGYNVSPDRHPLDMQHACSPDTHFMYSFQGSRYFIRTDGPGGTQTYDVPEMISSMRITRINHIVLDEADKTGAYLIASNGLKPILLRFDSKTGSFTLLDSTLGIRHLWSSASAIFWADESYNFRYLEVKQSTPVPALTISTPSLPPATANQHYSAKVEATGGSGALTFRVASGSLPGGITLNQNSGELSSSMVTASPGTYPFTVEVTNAAGSRASKGFILTVNPARPAIAAITNAANGTDNKLRLARTMIATLWGSFCSETAANASTEEYPTTLGKAQVLWNNQPLPLLFVSPGQINFVTPDETSGNIQVKCLDTGLVSDPYSQALETVAAAAFTWLLEGRDVAAAAVEQYGQDTVYTLYLTGLGPTNPGVAPGKKPATLTSVREPVTASIQDLDGNFVPATVLFAGLSPQFPNVNQMNVIIPQGNFAEFTVMRVTVGSTSSLVPIRIGGMAAE